MIREYKYISLSLWESERFSSIRKELLSLGWEVQGYSEFYFNGTEYIPKYIELERKE